MAGKELGNNSLFPRRDRWKRTEKESSHDNSEQPTTTRGNKGPRNSRSGCDIYDRKDVNAPYDESIETASTHFLNLAETVAEESKCSFDSLSKDMECLTDDGGVKKRLLLEGITTSEDQFQVEDGCRVWYHFELYGENCKPYCLDSTISKKYAATLTLGEEGLLGLYVGLKTMKKKEIAEFIFDPVYAFGKIGVPGFISANTRVRVIVQLEEVVLNAKLAVEFMSEEERKNATFQEILAGVERLMTKGNDKFEKRFYREACDRYTWALSLFDDFHQTMSDKEDNIIGQKKYLLFSILAQSYIRDKQYQSAAEICEEALRLKGLDVDLEWVIIYRYALASFHLGDFEKTRTLCDDGLKYAWGKEELRILKANAEYEIALLEDKQYVGYQGDLRVTQEE